MEDGRVFQIAGPENARLFLLRSHLGNGGIQLFELYRLVDVVKSERMYPGVSCVCVRVRACMCVWLGACTSSIFRAIVTSIMSIKPTAPL